MNSIGSMNRCRYELTAFLAQLADLQARDICRLQCQLNYRVTSVVRVVSNADTLLILSATPTVGMWADLGVTV
jgi:hypothetical protein